MFKDALKIERWNNYWGEQTELLLKCRDTWYLPSIGQHEFDDGNGLTGRKVQLTEVWNSLISQSITKPEDLFDIVAE
jgi:hypothetical protein